MLDLDDILGVKLNGKKKCDRCSSVNQVSYKVPDLGYHSCPQNSNEDYYSSYFTESAYSKDTITNCIECYKKDLLDLKLKIEEQLKDMDKP